MCVKRIPRLGTLLSGLALLPRTQGIAQPVVLDSDGLGLGSLTEFAVHGTGSRGTSSQETALELRHVLVDHIWRLQAPLLLCQHL